MVKKILVTAATGHIATFAIPQLLEKDIKVRAFVHNVSKAEYLKKIGAEIIEGNFSDEEKLTEAMKDVRMVLSITPAGPDAASNAANITRAAKNAGVEHLIRISAIFDEVMIEAFK